MAETSKAQQHTYCLLVEEGAREDTRRIELEASDPSAAMFFAQRQLSERNIEIFEDGQHLGYMRCTREGYWTVLPGARRQLPS